MEQRYKLVEKVLGPKFSKADIEFCAADPLSFTISCLYTSIRNSRVEKNDQYRIIYIQYIQMYLSLLYSNVIPDEYMNRFFICLDIPDYDECMENILDCFLKINSRYTSREVDIRQLLDYEHIEKHNLKYWVDVCGKYLWIGNHIVLGGYHMVDTQVVANILNRDLGVMVGCHTCQNDYFTMGCMLLRQLAHTMTPDVALIVVHAWVNNRDNHKNMIHITPNVDYLTLSETYKEFFTHLFKYIRFL